MTNKTTPVVAIIGGGFCGMMTAVHLIQKSTAPLKIIIINKDYPFGKGVAYSAHTTKYLLNVRAVNMSAYPDMPQHFLDWAGTLEQYRDVPKNILTNVYMPRKVYGAYLSSVWKDALEKKPEWAEIKQLDLRATDIYTHRDHYKIDMEDGTQLHADLVVLATGNTKPVSLPVVQNAVNETSRYFSNPWTEACVAGAHATKDVFIVGNGLTMIDTVLGLLEKGFKHKIYTLSRGGFSLLPHKYNLLTYDKVAGELPKDRSLRAVVQLVKRHAKQLAAIGIGEHLIIDALRPYSHNIWLSWTSHEKRAFLKKLSHAWSSLRHRIPLHIFEYIQSLRIQQRLVTYNGTLIGAIETSDGIQITFANKQTMCEETITVDRMINCTGPDANIGRSSNALIRTLAAKGYIVPDAL